MSTVLAEQAAPELSAPRPRAASQENPPLQVASLPDGIAGELVPLFKLLADETRLHILYFLIQSEELNVGTLCGLLQQSQPAVSHHLALMRGHGLIEMRREGKHNFYRLAPRKFRQHLDTIFTLTPPAAANATMSATVAETAAEPASAAQVRIDDHTLTYEPVKSGSAA